MIRGIFRQAKQIVESGGAGDIVQSATLLAADTGQIIGAARFLGTSVRASVARVEWASLTVWGLVAYSSILLDNNAAAVAALAALRDGLADLQAATAAASSARSTVCPVRCCVSACACMFGCAKRARIPRMAHAARADTCRVRACRIWTACSCRSCPRWRRPPASSAPHSRISDDPP